METQADNWNWVYIDPPPYTTLKYSWDEDSEVLRNYLPIWQENFSCLGIYYNKGRYSSFLKECELLNVLISNHKRHGKEKSYNLLLQIRKCVRNMISGQVFNFLKKFLQMIPFSAKVRWSVHLPTRQLFEYMLIRIFGLVQLLLTIDKLCLQVAKILIENLKKGYDLNVALAFLPALARVRVLALNFAQQLASLYDEVSPTLHYLKGSPRFSLSSSSLLQDLRVHFQYEKDADIRIGASGKIESHILDIFEEEESEEMTLGVSTILSRFEEKFGLKVGSDDNMDYTLSDKSHDTNDLTNESGSAPKVEVSKEGMGLSEPQRKKELKLSEKEKELLSILDILNDDLDDNTTGFTVNSHESNEKSESKNESSVDVVDSLMKLDDVGKIVSINGTGNKKKKIKQKKISECGFSGGKAIQKKGKSVKKKKKLLHQSGSVATKEDSNKVTVNDTGEKVEPNLTLTKKKRKIDKVVSLAESESRILKDNNHMKKRKIDKVVSLAENESRILKNKKYKSQSRAEGGDRVQNGLGDRGIAAESNVSQVEIRKKEKSSSHKKDKKKCKQMDCQSNIVSVSNELSSDSVKVNKDKAVKKKKKKVNL